MIIEETAYKDRPAVRVASGTLEAVILPEDGGKIASLRCRETGFEFLCQSQGPRYLRLDGQGAYIDSECSGFDDMFPTIDAETSPAGLRYPDHGEICRLPHELRLRDDGVELRARSTAFPVSWCRRITQSPDGGLVLDYRIENQSREDFPCLWAAHCMLRGLPGARVLAGYDGDDEIEFMFSSHPDRFAPRGRRPWAGVPAVDRLESEPDGAAYKYYFTGPVRRGFCGCEYPGVGRLLFSYDGERLPYLGIWMNNEGFQGKRNIALEPCTAPYDSPGGAAVRGLDAALPAGGAFTFAIAVDLMR